MSPLPRSGPHLARDRGPMVFKFHRDQRILWPLWGQWSQSQICMDSFGWSWPNLECKSTLMLLAYIQNFTLIGSSCHPLGVKKYNFTHFQIQYSVAVSRSAIKVQHRCTTMNLSLSTVPKPFLYSNTFMVKWHSKSLSIKSVNVWQTNFKQTIQ